MSGKMEGVTESQVGHRIPGWKDSPGHCILGYSDGGDTDKGGHPILRHRHKMSYLKIVPRTQSLGVWATGPNTQTLHPRSLHVYCSIL